MYVYIYIYIYIYICRRPLPVTKAEAAEAPLCGGKQSRNPIL